MKITRDIINDLLPLYQSGDASPDTRELVETFLKDDPEFSRTVLEQKDTLSLSNQPHLPKEIEMQTLEKTKKVLWQRSMYLGAAIFFSLFTFAIQFDSHSVRWIWSGMPIAAGACLAVGILFWALFAHANGKLKGSGL